MITFSKLSDAGVLCVFAKKKIAVFPGEKDKTDADISVFSSPDEDPAANTVSWPGEYDFDGVSVRGIGHDEGKFVSYVMQADDVRCAFLSAPLHDWTDHELELLGNVDVLVIAAEEPKLVQKLVDEIDPRIFIPLEVKGQEKAYTEILKNSGAQGVEEVKEYKQKGALPAEGREVVVLK